MSSEPDESTHVQLQAQGGHGRRPRKPSEQRFPDALGRDSITADWRLGRTFRSRPGTCEDSDPRGGTSAGLQDGKAQSGGQASRGCQSDSPATRDACVSLGSKWPRGQGRRLGQGGDNMDSFPPRSLTWLCFLLPRFSGQPEIPRLSLPAGDFPDPSLQEAREAALG